jgi:hypothetical protein
MLPLRNDTAVRRVEMVDEFGDEIFLRRWAINLLEIFLVTVVQLAVIIHGLDALKQFLALIPNSAGETWNVQ